MNPDPKLTVTALPPCFCPHCGNEFDKACHVDNLSPKPGQLALCLQCGEIAEFGPGLGLKKPSQEKLSRMNLIDLQRGRQIYNASRARVRGEGP